MQCGHDVREENLVTRGTRTQWTNHPYLFEGLIIFFRALLLESNSCPAFCQITLVYKKGTRVHYPSNFHGFPPLMRAKRRVRALLTNLQFPVRPSPLN